MPRAWSPKPFDHPSCEALGDLVLVEHDLTFAIECLDHLLKNVLIVPMSGGGEIRVVQAISFPDRAVLNAAVIAYRRCFASGVRDRLDQPEYQSENFGDLASIHSYFMELANKHVAHSVNPFEEPSIGVDIGVDESGDIQIGAVRMGSAGMGGASEFQVAALRELCSKLIELQVKPKQESCKAEIMAAFKLLSLDEIRALPDGLKVYAAKAEDVSASRPRNRAKRSKIEV